MVSKAQSRATIKYSSKTYDKILLRTRKDADITRELIAKASEQVGESVNTYILKAIEERMKSEGFI